MKRKISRYVFCILFCMLFAACGQSPDKQNAPELTGTVTPEMSPAPSEVPTPTLTPTPTVSPTPTTKPTPTPIVFDYGLKDLYKDNFYVGVALPNSLIGGMGAKCSVMVPTNYNSITCENEMKPDALLDKSGCQADLEKTYLDPAVKFDSCKKAIKYAQENDMKIRLHTLVWHSQTPKWFFTEDYSENGTLVSREVMLARMENYIKKVLTYFDENYPGLIYAVDVCNEAFDSGNGDENGIRKVDNRWYDTVGPDYYYQAFVFARKYAPDYMKLFYNDYGCTGKSTQILKHLAQAKEEGLIDGIGMQSHLSITDNIQYKFMLTVKKFCEAGYEVQITELDIGIGNTPSAYNEYNLNAQARKYKLMFGGLKELQESGYNITSVTLWGASDVNSWRSKEYPLLFDKKFEPKPAYAGAMLAPDIFAVD